MRDEKKQQKEALKEEMLRLGNLQRECKEEKIPVYITFDGYDGAGRLCRRQVPLWYNRGG